MKIIEAMKRIKEYQLKAEDLRTKVARYSADLDVETPTYGTEQEQRERVAGWVQAHHDLMGEILKLRVSIQRTNLETEVEIDLGRGGVKKSIAEWIHRRRDLANTELDVYKALASKDGQLREGVMPTTSGEAKQVKVRRYYDPGNRDEWMDLYRTEPLKIDATLEVVNATTELVGAAN